MWFYVIDEHFQFKLEIQHAQYTIPIKLSVEQDVYIYITAVRPVI